MVGYIFQFTIMNIKEIPQEYREEIKEIMERRKTMLYLPFKDRQTLFNYYYRYIYNLRKGEKVEEKIQEDIFCGNCIAKVIHYYKEIVNEW